MEIRAKGLWQGVVLNNVDHHLICLLCACFTI